MEQSELVGVTQADLQYLLRIQRLWAPVIAAGLARLKAAKAVREAVGGVAKAAAFQKLVNCEGKLNAALNALDEITELSA